MPEVTTVYVSVSHDFSDTITNATACDLEQSVLSVRINSFKVAKDYMTSNFL